MNWRLIISLVLLSVRFTSNAEVPVIVGRVIDTEGNPVASIQVRVIGISEGRTSSTGEFKIPLGYRNEAGSEVMLSIAKPGWMVKSPAYGQVILPRDPEHVITVILARIPVQVSETTSPTDVITFTAAGKDAESKKDLMLDDSFTRWGSWDQDMPYSLKVHVRAHFRNVEFNTVQYFDGLRTTTCLGETCRGVSDGSMNEAGTEMNFTLHLGFAKRPNKSETFSFTTGPRAWTVKLGPLDWETHTGKSVKTFTWYGAQADLNVALVDPDWVVLRSARLLPLLDKNQYLLEAIVENRSSIPIPLDYLVVSLGKPRGNRNNCINGDPPETLTLNWERILDGANPQDTSPVWAELGTSKVQVYSKARLFGTCSNFSFSATVPLETDVAPRQLERVQVKLIDIPAPRRRSVIDLESDGLSKVEDKPSQISDWTYLEAGIQGAYPYKRKIEIPLPRTDKTTQ